jgi:hypothetical protein
MPEGFKKQNQSPRFGMIPRSTPVALSQIPERLISLEDPGSDQQRGGSPMDFTGKATDSESDDDYYDFHGDHGMNFSMAVINFIRIPPIETMKPANASDFNGNTRIDNAMGAAQSGMV